MEDVQKQCERERENQTEKLSHRAQANGLGEVEGSVYPTNDSEGTARGRMYVCMYEVAASLHHTHPPSSCSKYKKGHLSQSMR